MNHWLDLNLLPIAVALYEERHVNRTATRLGMSQPAVSAALARLRKAFDDPLFIRTARGMEPTPRAHRGRLDFFSFEFLGLNNGLSEVFVSRRLHQQHELARTLVG